MASSRAELYAEGTTEVNGNFAGGCREEGGRYNDDLRKRQGVMRTELELTLDKTAFLGVILGLVTAFFIGLFMVPRRYVKSDSLTFMVGMTAGAAVGSAAYWLLAGMPFAHTPAALLSVVIGANWAVGTYAYAAGTRNIGLAKATAIKNTQPVVTTIGGFLFFNEAATTNPVFASAGAFLVVVTAYVLSSTAHREESVPDASLRGYLVPIIASVLYGANGLGMKLLTEYGVPRPQMNLGIGVGAMLGGMGTYVIVRRRFDFLKAASARDHALAALGGVVWAVALVTMIVSVAYVGVAVSWALLNLSIVISVLYGVIVLKEIDMGRRWRQVIGGLFLAGLGVLALYAAKAMPALGR